MPVSTPLKRFLAVLATDLDRLAEYLRNPDEVMHEAGLSKDDVAALRSGDPSALEARFDREGSTAPMAQPWTIEPSFRIPTFTYHHMIESTCGIPTFTHMVIVECGARAPASATHSVATATDQERSRESPESLADQPRIVRPPTH
jgi:hypothetical protein